MSAHAARRPSLAARLSGWFGDGWFGRGRTRALAALGVLVALGVATTSAYWTDSATVTGGTISSGSLDITAGPTTGAEHLTGTGPSNWDFTALSITDMIPNESVARTLVVRNSGTAPLRFNATVRSTTGDLTSGTSGLQVQVFDQASSATNTGTQAGGDRTGTCTGTQRYSGYVSVTASASIFPADIDLPTTGASRTLCVRAWLDQAAPNTLQGRSTNVQLTLSAVQLSAP